MNITFVYNGAENLGIESLSAFLASKGHTTSLLFDPAIFSGDQLVNNALLAKIFNRDRVIVERILALRPDVVGFSVFTGNYRWCLRIAEEIKKHSDIPVVFGGVHTSALPETVLANPCVDYVVVGEGEHAFLELVEALGKDTAGGPRGIANVGYKAGGKVFINAPRAYIRDLDSLPFPDKPLFYDKVPLLQENYMISTSRGCPFDCTYCSNSMLHGLYASEKNHLRRRSPHNVIDELKWARSQWNIRLVNFVDDVFVTSRAWLEEFIELYKREIALPFFCSVHPHAMTQEVARLLKSGGCWLVTMGVQSGSERIRKEIFLRSGSNADIARSIDHVKKAGIKISLDNIFGAPTETEYDVQQGMALYQKAKADRIVTFWLTYYPGTRILAAARERGILDQKDIDGINEGNAGFAHGGGGARLDARARKLYLKYAILFQLRSLIHNDALFSLAARIVVHLPGKGMVIKLIILFNAIKNNDIKAYYLMRFMLAPKRIP